jgi:hypothetical protein
MEETDEIVSSGELISPLCRVSVVDSACERRESVPIDDIKGILDAGIYQRKSTRD